MKWPEGIALPYGHSCPFEGYGIFGVILDRIQPVQDGMTILSTSWDTEPDAVVSSDPVKPEPQSVILDAKLVPQLIELLTKKGSEEHKSMIEEIKNLTH